MGHRHGCTNFGAAHTTLGLQTSLYEFLWSCIHHPGPADTAATELSEGAADTVVCSLCGAAKHWFGLQTPLHEVAVGLQTRLWGD